MARYEIKRQEWLEAANGTIVGPILSVALEGSEAPETWIGLQCSSGALRALERKLPEQQHDFWVARLRAAFWRYAVEQVERVLAEDAIDLDGQQQNRDLGDDELKLIVARAVGAKTCSYQVPLGRDLGCQATRGRGTQITSKSLCMGCPIPDDEYLCSALTGAEAKIVHVKGQSGMTLHALCDLGRSEIVQPAGCTPMGHSCWHRTVESHPFQFGEVDPRGLPEAIDFLNATWRLAFKKALFQLRSAQDVVALVQPCTSRAEFKSAISVLDDIVKQMVVDDELLSAEDRERDEIKGDKTLNRLTACASTHLPTENRVEAVDAIKVLRRVNTIRQALQHSRSSSELGPAFAALGINEPIVWSNAWDEMRRRVIHALAMLRRSLQPLTR